MNFENMNLIAPLLTAVADYGYDEPTPIQRETIPPVLEGKDVLGCAQTGTGKTAAFALPILQRLNEERKPLTGRRPIRALILTPTRELAMQIYENFVGYGKRLALRSCVIFGGVSQYGQVEQLRRGVDILVATPGRLNDLIGQGFINLSHVEIFVLDEADRMLDMGFIIDVRKVIALLPEKKQTLFFSATMPNEVEKLALSILDHPVMVKVDPVTSTVDAIDQSIYLVDKVNKKLLLADLLHKPEVESALVFTRTKHGADRVVRELESAHINSKAIHGDKSQCARQQALADFKNNRIRVLVATDIAARGIDIAGLSHVINYDLPNEPEAYIHRIGRTGRAGLEGAAISFCCIDEMKDLKAIERLIGKPIPKQECPWPMQVFVESIKPSRMSHGAGRLESSSPRGMRQASSERGLRQASPERSARQSAAERMERAARRGGNDRDEGFGGERAQGKGAGYAPHRAGAGASYAGGRSTAYGARAHSAAKPMSRLSTPVARDAQGASSAMRSTPLERPVRSSAAAAAGASSERRYGRSPEHESSRGSVHVHEPMAQERSSSKRMPKRPLATGLDRR
ncbi:MAG: DEAD/DEAH box helicase [Clostridia bacterium]